MSKIELKKKKCIFFLECDSFCAHRHIANMHHNYLMLNPAKPVNQYNNENPEYLFFLQFP